MTETKKRSTLSLGGTLSATAGAKASNAGVAVEVRRRRFQEAPAATGKTGDAELDRRMQALQSAQAKESEEAAKREAERKRLADLQAAQQEQVQTAKDKDEARKAAEETAKREEAERKEAVRKAADQQGGVRAQAVATGGFGKNASDTFRKQKDSTGGKPADKGNGKKKGRNAYLGNLEQRYRTMGNTKRTGRRRDADDMNQEPQEKIIRDVEISDFVTVGELANRMAEKSGDVVKKLMMMGEMVTVNQTIDQETAILVIEEFGHKYNIVNDNALEEALIEQKDDPKDLEERPPVVTVMGHVDHGKTTLLDALRSANVVKGEAGGITQHIGAYQATNKSGRKMTFLDTPGHAAFTAMRARGAQVTDIVILVVAADDGIMPQTKEAIQHAQAAGVPIVVAINKMDKPDANPEKVKNELLAEELVLEDFGGDIPAVPISALTGKGLDDLEEVLLLQADVLELKGNPKRRAEGAVVEAQLDKGRGPVATVVVQNGTLNVGDILVAGSIWGRVRALVNDKGENLKTAGPAMPVEVLGLQGVPEAGDQFTVAQDDRQAKEVAEFRGQKKREAAQAARKLSLDNLFDRMEAEGRADLNVIIKGDVQGSVEAISQTLKQLNSDQNQVKVNVIHGAVGVVTETDVNLAMAGGGIIVGFNVRSDAMARQIAEREGVEVRYYSVIYELIDDVKAAMSGLLAPAFEEEITGGAEIRAIFKFGKTRIAGCMVTDGKLQRNGKVRLLRDGVVVHDGNISTLKREKDDAKEVASGYECGMTLENYTDIQEGDTLEAYRMNEIKRTIDDLKKAAEREKSKAKKAEKDSEE